MTNYFDLKGRVAVVTGASTGLGLQMAKALPAREQSSCFLPAE